MIVDKHGAFVAMYEANYLDLLRYVRRRTHEAVVDDIVAETFMTAWRRRDSLPQEARPWLFRTAHNIMMSTARSQLKQIDLAIRSYEPEATPADIERSLDLKVAWRQLPRADQEVIALHVWENLTDGEAAEVLECSRAAFAMRLSRAKRRLTRAMRDASEVDRVPAHQLGIEEGIS